MERKITGLSIALLLLAVIPSTSIATVTPMQDGTGLLLKGTIKISEIENNTVHAFAFRLFYLEWTETEWTLGWLTLTTVTFHDGFIKIPIGKLTFIIGITTGFGGIEWNGNRIIDKIVPLASVDCSGCKIL